MPWLNIVGREKTVSEFSFRFLCNYFISEISAQTFPITFSANWQNIQWHCFWCLSMIVRDRAKNYFKTLSNTQSLAEKKLRSSSIFIFAIARPHLVNQKRPANRQKNKSAKIIGKSVQSYIHLMNRMRCESLMRVFLNRVSRNHDSVVQETKKRLNLLRSLLNLSWCFFLSLIDGLFDLICSERMKKGKKLFKYQTPLNQQLIRKVFLMMIR